MELSVKELCVNIDKKPIVKNVSLSVPEGKFVVLLGPNGSGKSTLLKAIYRTLPYQSGSVYLNQKNVKEISYRDFAAQVAVVSQFSNIAFDFSVEEIVMMGRSPHLGVMGREGKEDIAIVEEALEAVGMAEYAKRAFATLSGGEKQRVLLARAIAQKPLIMILDEPTNHLDIRYQLQVLAIVKRMGITCIAALHDLNLASQFGDLIYLLCDGKIVANGTPQEVLNPATIREVYQVNSSIVSMEDTGQLVISYHVPES